MIYYKSPPGCILLLTLQKLNPSHKQQLLKISSSKLNTSRLAHNLDFAKQIGTLSKSRYSHICQLRCIHPSFIAHLFSTVTLILGRLLTFLVAFSILVLKPYFPQSISLHSHLFLAQAYFLEFDHSVLGSD